MAIVQAVFRPFFGGCPVFNGSPTPFGVGCILTPLRGWDFFERASRDRVLTRGHTVSQSIPLWFSVFSVAKGLDRRLVHTRPGSGKDYFAAAARASSRQVISLMFC